MSNKKFAEIVLSQLVDTIEKAADLKYNIFSQNHPNMSLRGKLFKFTKDAAKTKVDLLKDKTTVDVTDKDLYDDKGKRLFFPADAY